MAPPLKTVRSAAAAVPQARIPAITAPTAILIDVFLFSGFVLRDTRVPRHERLARSVRGDEARCAVSNRERAVEMGADSDLNLFKLNIDRLDDFRPLRNLAPDMLRELL